jgi:exoribonuclease R
MIPGILRLNSKIKYGLTSRNVPLYLFSPLDTSLKPCIVGCSSNEKTNVLALINVEKWEPEKLTRGNLVRIIGKCGDIEAEEEALFIQYSSKLWKNFRKDSLNTPLNETHEYIQGFTFNVDPAGCTDIDDAITIGDDGYIYIVIADVSSWMKWNHTLFATASKIGQTLYKNGKVVAPLLPIQEECSLSTGNQRRGIALKFRFDEKITDISFQKVIVTNNKTFTYESIYESPHKNFLKKLASHIAGYTVEDSHEWIEQIMKFYNLKVANELIKKKAGLLRIQPEPCIEKLKEYKDFVDLSFLANKSAVYSWATNPQKHWSLQEYYCHATSPIRRFADIVNQMVLVNEVVSEIDIDYLNFLQKQAKRYERDLLFIQKLLNTHSRQIQGIVLNDHRVWVPEWKRIVTCKNNCNPGKKGVLKYSLDMEQATWKKRMVFRFEDTDCLVQQTLE